MHFDVSVTLLISWILFVYTPQQSRARSLRYQLRECCQVRPHSRERLGFALHGWTFDTQSVVAQKYTLWRP